MEFWPVRFSLGWEIISLKIFHVFGGMKYLKHEKGVVIPNGKVCGPDSQPILPAILLTDNFDGQAAI